jgi:D-alanyl-D-alanine carboxypeptidase/D-alanyl-D-alanine-endopeptidase (penicillin-binding protein 4)
MKNIFILLLLCFIVSCVGLKRASIKKSFKKSTTFNKGYTGFALYDPERKKMVYAQNEGQYFIPASNIKLFTFYAAQKILGDSIAGLNYIERGDSLIFWGTGDPSFLHPDLQNSAAYDFLKMHPKKLFYANNFHEVIPLGRGWSWDWYNYYFATERSAFPIYGNFIRIKKMMDETTFSIQPHYFHETVREDPGLITDNFRFARAHYSNKYSFLIKKYDSLEFEIDRPFIASDTLIIRLLEDTLQKNVQLIPHDDFKIKPHKVLYTIQSDSLFKKMLKDSDNFLAEQLLLLCSNVLFDSLNMDSVFNYAKSNFFNSLPDEPKWADGSGLSSFNLVTPRSIIALLNMIHQEYPEEKTLQYLPTGGESGTIKNFYKADIPYVFAKTGTLSNSVCLSGYLITKKGKKLIFSFMHNNYVIPSSELKKEMERILWQIHTSY